MEFDDRWHPNSVSWQYSQHPLPQLHSPKYALLASQKEEASIDMHFLATFWFVFILRVKIHELVFKRYDSFMQGLDIYFDQRNFIVIA